MEKKGWLMIDIHSGNILCNKQTNDYYFIDFGWAIKKGSTSAEYKNHPLFKSIGIDPTEISSDDWNDPETFNNFKKVQQLNLLETVDAKNNAIYQDLDEWYNNWKYSM